MAEFKVNPEVLTQISSVKKAADALNEEYEKVSSKEVKSLKTAKKILEQHKDIKDLIALYQSLIQRDAKDVKKMVEEVTQMDESISRSVGGGSR